MPFKPNYNFQRAERDRLKQAKKEAKKQERAEAALRSKTEEGAAPSDSPQPGSDEQAPPDGG